MGQSKYKIANMDVQERVEELEVSEVVGIEFFREWKKYWTHAEMKRTVGRLKRESKWTGLVMKGE